MDPRLCSVLAANKHLERLDPRLSPAGRFSGCPHGSGGCGFLHRPTSGAVTSGHRLSPISATAGSWDPGRISDLGLGNHGIIYCFS